jgi:transposase-like protein
MTAKVLGIPKASLSNWVRSSEQGQLGGAGDRHVTPEQMELARKFHHHQVGSLVPWRVVMGI